MKKVKICMNNFFKYQSQESVIRLKAFVDDVEIGGCLNQCGACRSGPVCIVEEGGSYRVTTPEDLISTGEENKTES